MTGPSGTGPAGGARTWRPYGARIAASVLGGLLLALVIGIWIALGAEERARFTLFQRTTLVLIGLCGFVALHAIARSRVTADALGVTVVNGYRRRAYEWSQVGAVNLRRGAPWAGMDLSDGTSIPVMAIQGSDGRRAIRAVQELRGVVTEHTRIDRDD